MLCLEKGCSGTKTRKVLKTVSTMNQATHVIDINFSSFRVLHPSPLFCGIDFAIAIGTCCLTSAIVCPASCFALSVKFSSLHRSLHNFSSFLNPRLFLPVASESTVWSVLSPDLLPAHFNFCLTWTSSTALQVISHYQPT